MDPLDINRVPHEEHEIPQSAQEDKDHILTSIVV